MEELQQAFGPNVIINEVVLGIPFPSNGRPWSGRDIEFGFKVVARNSEEMVHLNPASVLDDIRQRLLQCRYWVITGWYRGNVEYVVVQDAVWSLKGALLKRPVLRSEAEGSVILSYVKESLA